VPQDLGEDEYATASKHLQDAQSWMNELEKALDTGDRLGIEVAADKAREAIGKVKFGTRGNLR
jgi:hypothetical protein